MYVSDIIADMNASITEDKTDIQELNDLLDIIIGIVGYRKRWKKETNLKGFMVSLTSWLQK